MDWTKIPDQTTIDKTIEALKVNGIDVLSVENGKDAFDKVFRILPKGSSVMTMSSVTLDALGISKEINESGNYDSIKNKLNLMDRKTQSRQMQVIGSSPEWAVGSVHAVTEDGKILIASNTGSQLPAYVYGSDHVIWVIGAQKIVKDLDQAWKRLYEHTLPLETERLKKVYGVPSNVSKVLIVQKEIKPGRITAIFVRKVLGF